MILIIIDCFRFLAYYSMCQRGPLAPTLFSSRTTVDNEDDEIDGVVISDKFEEDSTMVVVGRVSCI